MSKTRGLGPHSKTYRLARLDGRTHIAKLVDEYRANLVEHVGGAPSITQDALIERASFVHLRCALLDAKVAAGTMTEQDSRCYLAAVNAERRLLAQLGMEASATATPPMDALSYARAVPDDVFFAQRAAADREPEAAD